MTTSLLERRAVPLAAALTLLACGSSAPARHDGGDADAGSETRADGGDDVDPDQPDGGSDGPRDMADGPGADRPGGDAGGAGDGGASMERLFVATFLGGISSFAVDGVTGRAEPAAGSPFDVGAQLYALTVHPSGRFLYATDLRGTLLGYAIAPDTGTLTHLPGSPVTIGSAAIAADLDPSGRFLYVGDDQALHAFAVAPESGALTAVAGSPFDLGGQPCTLAFHPSGRFLFASFVAIGPDSHGGIRTFVLDATSGVPTEAAGSPLLTDQVRGGGLALHPSGKFLYVGSFNLRGFLVDEETGALTALPGFPLPGGNSDSTALDVAVAPSGRYLYATDFAGSLYGYAIDAATGALTAVPGSPFDGRPDPYSVAVDPGGRFVYLGNDDANLVSAFSLDPATGALAPTAGSPFTVNGLQPELALAPAR